MKNLISALLIFLPFIGLSQYKPMNQPYQFNSETKFADTVFLDTAMQGQGVFLVMDTLTGEVKRDTVPAVVNGDSVLSIVRANVDTSGTLNLQQVTDNDSVTDNGITINSNFLNVGFDNNISSGFPFSMALGAYDTIVGNYVLATGFNVYGKGNSSVVHGLNSRSIGDLSFAIGDDVESWGNASFSQGVSNFARSFGEVTMGVYSTDYVGFDTISVVGTDRLFSIGNGTSTSNRNNALTMLKNGTTTIDTTWSYDSSMSPYSFSGLEIPHTEWIQGNFALNTQVMQTDTFQFDSAQIVALETGEDTLITTTTGKFIDVISLSVISIGSTGYTFSGDLVIKSENGTISTPATTILTSAGAIFRKSSIQSDAELGEFLIFDIQGSGATAGNKTFAVVVHYKIITI